MAKKSKDEVPNPNSVTNRDILQRLNFLYQASTYLNTISLDHPPDPIPGPSGPSVPTDPALPKPHDDIANHTRKRARRIHKITAVDLSRNYIASMKLVGQKTTVKIDPGVKRTLCKGCNQVLVPGSTASVRVKKSTSHGQAVTYTCTKCNTSRRIPAPPTLLPEISSEEQQSVSIPGNSAPLSHTVEDEAINVDDLPGGSVLVPSTESAKPKQGSRRRKKPPTPRLPPQFARDVGHVVFRGNEKLSLDGGDSGIFII